MRNRWLALLGCAFSFAFLAAPQGEAVADELPPGFYETTVIERPALEVPAAVAFAPDGDVFVAEKDGMLLRFDGLDDPTAETVLDFRAEANNFGDRGFLGLALDPDYASNHYAYISYTYDAPVGGTAPTHALPPPRYDDSCVNQCEVTARIERLDVSGTTPVPRTVLIQDDFCNQYQSHSIGTLAFDSQRRLYVGGGDGASYIVADYGQATGPDDAQAPWNPCADPGGPEGTPLSLPNGEGGALRSQDFRTTGDPLGLSGSVIRIDPDTGLGDPANPLYNPAAPASNESRMLAYGFRNPFRFTVSPDDGRLWIGDAGWKSREEIDSFPTSSATVPNFGWPCYEGAARQPEYDPLNLTLCENLYAAGPSAVQAPTFDYDHHAELFPGDPCPVPGDGSATSGITFYTGDSFPASYDGSMFFTDYARHCIWHVPLGLGGQPNFNQMEAFDQNVVAPVDLKIGPDGGLYYVDIGLGEVRRIQHTAGNTPPEAVATADPEYGGVPLEVDFDATGSTDADASDTLAYEWDLNGDGDFNDSVDSTSASPTHTYNSAQTVNVHLRVSDGSPETDTDTIRIDVGNNPPAPTIISPLPGTTWTVGQQLNFQGAATDPDELVLQPEDLRWDVTLNHCAPGGGCHEHHQTTLDGDDNLQITAPDHGYPAHLSVKLTATDNKGLARSTTLVLQPNTVAIQSQSVPSGLVLQIGDVRGPAPQTVTAIQGSQLQATADTPQTLSAISYNWCRWSDGGGLSHNFTAATSMTLTATFAANCPPTNSALSNSNVAENRPPGTAVGTLSTTDPDGGGPTYTFVNGTGDTDNSQFQIEGSTLRTSASFDYESKSNYTVRIRTHDGSGAFDKAFPITVTDANDAPTNISLSSSTVTENQPSGTTVGTLSSTDQDGGDSHTYSIVGGDSGAFSLSGTTLRTAANYDYETKSTYSITVRSDDGHGGTFDKALTVNVGNANDQPTNLALSNSSVNENQTSATTVGTLSSTDQDAADTHTYSLVAGTGSTDNGSFSISGTSLRTAASFNFEAKSSYSIRAQTSDGNGGTFAKQLTITVGNVNEAPTDVALSSASVAENRPTGTVVGTLSSTDPDAGSSHSYSLVPGAGSTDNGSFAINSSSLTTNATFDFETKSSYSVRVQTSDGNGGTFAKQLTISVTDTSEPPTDISLSNASIAENQASGTTVGTLSSADPDGGTHVYSLVSGAGSTDNGSFSITGTSLKTAASFDFETKTSYSIRVRSDGGGVFEKQLTITVADVNEPTTGISLSNSSVAENEAAGTSVGTLSSADPDQTAHTYALVSGAGADDNAEFTVSQNTLRTASQFDRETKSSYSIRLRSENGAGDSFERQVTITVSNVNEAPATVTASGTWVAENLPPGSLVANLGSDDPDAGDTATYALGGGADDGDFRIEGSELVTARTFDFEADPDRQIRIGVTDAEGLSADAAFTIAIADVEDLPSEIKLSNASIGEHLPTGSTVGDLAADDQDAGDSSRFSLVPGPGAEDNGDFTIEGATLSTATELERNDGVIRSIRIRATDQYGGVLERAFTIAVLADTLELSVLRLKLPKRPPQLIDDGVRALLRCTTGCRAQVDLVASGRLARKLGLRGIVGSEGARLSAGEERWVAARLDRRSERLLADYDGRRMPTIEPSFEARRR